MELFVHNVVKQVTEKIVFLKEHFLGKREETPSSIQNVLQPEESTKSCNSPPTIHLNTVSTLKPRVSAKDTTTTTTTTALIGCNGGTTKNPQKHVMTEVMPTAPIGTANSQKPKIWTTQGTTKAFQALPAPPVTPKKNVQNLHKINQNAITETTTASPKYTAYIPYVPHIKPIGTQQSHQNHTWSSGTQLLSLQNQNKTFPLYQVKSVPSAPVATVATQNYAPPVVYSMTPTNNTNFQMLTTNNLTFLRHNPNTGCFEVIPSFQSVQPAQSLHTTHTTNTFRKRKSTESNESHEKNDDSEIANKRRRKGIPRKLIFSP